MSDRSHLVSKPIVNVNGVATTVKVNPNKGKGAGKARNNARTAPVAPQPVIKAGFPKNVEGDGTQRPVHATIEKRTDALLEALEAVPYKGDPAQCLAREGWTLPGAGHDSAAALREAMEGDTSDWQWGENGGPSNSDLTDYLIDHGAYVSRDAADAHIDPRLAEAISDLHLRELYEIGVPRNERGSRDVSSLDVEMALSEEDLADLHKVTTDFLANAGPEVATYLSRAQARRSRDLNDQEIQVIADDLVTSSYRNRDFARTNEWSRFNQDESGRRLIDAAHRDFGRFGIHRDGDSFRLTENTYREPYDEAMPMLSVRVGDQVKITATSYVNDDGSPMSIEDQRGAHPDELSKHLVTQEITGRVDQCEEINRGNNNGFELSIYDGEHSWRVRESRYSQKIARA